jgi:DMSO/TMAO reductase YedYZ molybdopterin-dependent catalytic subunit
MTAGPADPDPRRYGRGAFLALVAGGISAFWWGGPVWDAVSGPFRSTIAGLGTGTKGEWRIYAVDYPYPTFDRASWRLTVDGLVEKPLSLSYDDVLAQPPVEHVADFHCVTGWSVQDVRWQGVGFDALLELARPLPGATWVEFGSDEVPYTDGLSLEQLARPGVMIATGFDGRPLSQAQGSPLRVVMPEMYGYKGVKWLNRITLVDHEVIGFWEQRGYDRDAWVGRSNTEPRGIAS